MTEQSVKPEFTPVAAAKLPIKHIICGTKLMADLVENKYRTLIKRAGVVLYLDERLPKSTAEVYGEDCKLLGSFVFKDGDVQKVTAQEISWRWE